MPCTEQFCDLTKAIHCIAVYSSCFYGMSDLVLMDRHPSDEIFGPASPRTGSVSSYDCYKESRIIPDKTNTRKGVPQQSNTRIKIAITETHPT